jgi:6-phospho-beta-glucosidase
MKICVLGCGLRTPLLIHGLIHSTLHIAEIALYDLDPARAQLMAQIGCEIAAGTRTPVSEHVDVHRALEGSDFVISSIRVGNMETRAADERLSLECGFAGQETTGPAGFAMALRTIPVALRYARIVERLAPSAWFVNFTNPAGIVTQAISNHTGARVVGICDTPAELLSQIARVLAAEPSNVHCDYFGLNHLGWVRSVRVGGKEMMDQLLNQDALSRRLYPTQLFSPDLLAAIRLLPTEYVFFYYNQEVARRNQLHAGVTRGEELQAMNDRVWSDLETHIRAGNPAAAFDAYRRYLNRRNASYMLLEGAAESAFQVSDPDWDPFAGETGYHRIAVETITALTSSSPRSIILNVPNHGSIQGMAPDDIVEVPCMVDHSGPRPLAVGTLPDPVRGLLLTMKHFERLTVEAAVTGRWDTAVFALTMNPIVASWDPARHFLERLAQQDTGYFSSYQRRDILQSTALTS